MATNTIKAGDIVRVGSGKKLWAVSEFWTTVDGKPQAQLICVDGYSRTSADLDRLTLEVSC